MNLLSPTPPVLPPVPRPLTAAARRRSWAEMPVRIWCVMAVALAVVIIYFTVNRVMESQSERALILNGTPVDAILVQINGTTDPAATFHRHEALEVKAQYALPNGQPPRRASGSLSPLTDDQAPIHPGDHIALRVDPADPDRWTDRTEPRSWVVELSVALLLFPVLLALLAIAMLQRARILRIWRNGVEAEAIVIEARQTAIAPFSRLLRFTLQDGSSARVCSVLLPTRAGMPADGETILLIMPRGVPQRAVLAKLYI